jgi:putative spermidine/putrescine transport system substrate-binding protein
VNISVQTGNIPTNKNAVLPQAYIDTIGMTQEELMSKMYTPDWNAVVENHEERLNMVEQMMSNAGN